MDITTEHQRATEVEQQICSLIVRARGLILEQFGPLSDAIGAAAQLIAEAHTLARQYNLDEGHAWCLNEDFALSVDNKPPQWWKENLTDAAVCVNGQTAPQPAMRLRIFQNVWLRDYPPGCTVAVPRPKAERLLAEQRAYRV